MKTTKHLLIYTLLLVSKKTGIYTLNKSAIDQSKLRIADTFEQPADLCDNTPRHNHTIIQSTSSSDTPITPLQLNQMMLNKAKEGIEYSLKIHFQLTAASHVKK
jgi:hypothetical protein